MSIPEQHPVVTGIYRRSLRPFVRLVLPPKLKHKFHTFLLDLLETKRNWEYLRKNSVPYLPPPPRRLRIRAHGWIGIEDFMTTGRNIAQNLKDTLQPLGRDIYSYENILDFGCSCARVLLWFKDHPEGCHFYGSDIDGEAIAWDQKNVDFANFVVNDELPPLPFNSELFDLIYAVSVFTHLNEGYQFRWLEELKRVSKKGAILLLSIHGTYAQEMAKLPPQVWSQLEERGFVFVEDKFSRTGLPDFYQIAFHTKEYVMQNWSSYFNVVNYIERGLNNHQDLLVLQNPG